MLPERRIRWMRRALAVLACGLVGFAVEPIRAIASGQDKEKVKSGETVIVPTLNVLSQHYWADGTTPVIITISLEEVSGSERFVYRATKEIELRLGPLTGSFDPATVKIPIGKSVSDSIKLTTKQQGKMDLTCTPERRYDGMTIAPCQPKELEFLLAIHGIGIKPVDDQCPINIVKAFQVYLYNQSNPDTPVSPGKDVTVHLASENSNGSLVESDIVLTSRDPSRFVHYSPTRTGKDAIVANANYEGAEIKGKSGKTIFFPWWTFIAGMAGTLIGSLLRRAIGETARRRQNFIESLVFGFAFCLIVILFPTGTKLPNISQYLGPGLLFALAILVSGLGPEFLKQLIALVSPRGAEA